LPGGENVEGVSGRVADLAVRITRRCPVPHPTWHPEGCKFTVRAITSNFNTPARTAGKSELVQICPEYLSNTFNSS
jgi:hypothetical protein